MSLVGVIASLVARSLSLDYFITCGILAILSIHLTKRDSVVISIRRWIDSIFGIVLSTLLFLAFGYNFVVFSIFVFIFAYVSWVLKISEGIVPSLVLVSHLLLYGSFSADLMVNEFLLITVAVAVALLFNLIYPASSEKELKTHVESIDQLVRDHLYMLHLLLKDPLYRDEYMRHFESLDRKLMDTIDVVELVDKDLLFMNDHSFLGYFHMRKEQTNYIRHMYQHALKVEKLHPYALEIALFIYEMSFDIGIYNKAVLQMANLNKLQMRYKDSELPTTREEFEVRAMLYQILNEIESMLTVKIQFHHQYPEFNQKRFK